MPKKIAAYDLLVKVYDRIQDEAEHELWLDALQELCDGAENTFFKNELYIVDLGAGTGIFSIPLAKAGHQVVSVDLSEPMLKQMAAKLQNPYGARIAIVQQDLEIWETEKENVFDVAICLLDTINHLRPIALPHFFETVFKSLRPGGYFMFDFLSLDYIEEFLDDAHYGEEWSDKAFFWSNRFDAEHQRVYHQFSLYEGDGTQYRKSVSELVEYYHDPAIVDGYLERLGFEILSKDELGPENRHVRLCRKINPYKNKKLKLDF